MVDTDPAHAVAGPKRKRLLPQITSRAGHGPIARRQEWNEGFVADLRARTIILTFYSTGIRLSELTGLDDAAVNLQECQLKVTGKGDKQRIVPFGNELAEALRKYQDVRNSSVARSDDALFVTDKGQRMTSPQVRELVKQHLSRVTTMKKRSPHVLRHSFATAMLNNEAGIESVKKLLGHARLSTTEIYTHTTFEQLRRAYDKAHPET